MSINLDTIFEQFRFQPYQYFLTGSRALDCPLATYSSPSSDYDYVLHITLRHVLIGYLNHENIEITNSNYNGGFKFVLNGETYNIITACDIEFVAWKEALAILKLLIQIGELYRNVLQNKQYRCIAYESLRVFIKIMWRFGQY